MGYVWYVGNRTRPLDFDETCIAPTARLPVRPLPQTPALQDDTIAESGSAYARIHLSEIAASPLVQRGRVSARLTLDLGNQSFVIIPGVQEAAT